MSIEVRGRQEQLQVFIKNSNGKVSITDLMNKLEPLEALQVEMIYIFVEKPLQSDEVLNIIKVVNQFHMMVASITYVFQNKMIETLETIDVGHFDFYHDVLILNDIPMHTSITMYHGNMYVFGKVSGEIEFYSKQSKLYALSIRKLRLKINDMPMQYIQEMDQCVLKYQNRKETKLWQDQL